MGYWEHLRYILIGPRYDLRVRVAGVATLLADTVTTIYLLYFSTIPVREFNPLGMVLRSGGIIGNVLFLTVPVATFLLLVYAPGVLGDSIALSNFLMHFYAATINILNWTGNPVGELMGIPFFTTYIYAILFSTSFPLLFYFPDMEELDQEYRQEHGSWR